MRFTKLLARIPVVVLSLAALLGVGLLSPALPTTQARADDLDDLLSEMAKVAKKGDEAEALKLINKADESPDSRVTEAIAKLAKSKNDKIAAAAYRTAGRRKADDLVKLIKRACGDKKLYKDRKPVLLAALDAAAHYDDPKVRKSLRGALEDCVKKYIPRDSDVSTRAITAYGMERDVDVLEELFKWMDMVGSSGQSQGGKNVSAETRQLYDAAARAIYDALGGLTGQEIADPLTWHMWWDEQDQKKYEFPDPNKVEEPVEWDKITEWLDPAYKYKVKVPPGEGWKFAVPDQYCRARVIWTATGGEEFARVDFQIHNTTAAPQKTVRALMDWWLDDWKQNHFAEFVGDEEPEPEEIKIGGREFMMMKAKGVSGGRGKGWGNAERRIYMTKLNHLILYVALTSKLGLEDEVHSAWVDVIEKLEFED